MKIDPDVLDVLAMLDCDGTAVRITEQLDRKLYEKTNKVLVALGGKWTRGAKAHLFGSDPRPRLDLAMTTGEVETGQDVGFFETPAPLAKQLVKMAAVRPGQLTLEPSAGTGRIVDALLAVGAHVTALEWDATRRTVLRTRSVENDQLTVSIAEDFMFWGIEPDGGFDRVVMNPPFCKVGGGDHLDHVRRAFGMLGPSGVLVSVMPASVAFRRDRRYAEFRAWCEEHGTIDPLPEGSFKASGTGVNTVVVRLETR
jgi:predicted RNA methylase